MTERESSKSSAERLRWLRHLVIVPEAHARVFDLSLQLEMYDVFHVHWVSRVGHMVGTPAQLIALTALLNHLGWHDTGGLILGLGVVVPLLQLGYAARLDKAVAVAALGPVILMTCVAGLPALSLNPMSAGILFLVGLGIQTFSHLAEPVPPPWSGARGWRSLRESLRVSSPLRQLGFLMLTAVSLVLEAWASLRIFSFQVLFVMMQLGYRPALKQALTGRRPAIQRDWVVGWGDDACVIQRVKLDT